MTVTTEAPTDLLTELRRQEAEILADPDSEGCRMCISELEDIRASIAKIEAQPKTLPEGKKLYRLSTAQGSEEYGSHPDMLRDHIRGMVSRSGYASTLEVDFEAGEIKSVFTGVPFMKFTIEEV